MELFLFVMNNYDPLQYSYYKCRVLLHNVKNIVNIDIVYIDSGKAK